VSAGCLVVVLPIWTGCRSAAVDSRVPLPTWDVDRAEVVHWRSDHPSFDQRFALEASGLAASQRFLYVASEKYARLLQIDLSPDPRARVTALAVPPHSELEGVALHDGTLYLCDEANAAVYSAHLGDEQQLAVEPEHRSIEARELIVQGVRVQGNKIGFEGIEVSPDGRLLYVLLERSGDEASGCSAKIYRQRNRKGYLELEEDPLEVVLEDCTWRLTGLAWWGKRLLALKTQFPGERYQVVMIDPKSGEWKVVLELTEILRSLEEEGWSNNVEGIAVTSDGALWLVADNAVTGVIDEPLPPRTDQRTLLLRIPLGGGGMYN